MYQVSLLSSGHPTETVPGQQVSHEHLSVKDVATRHSQQLAAELDACGSLRNSHRHHRGDVTEDTFGLKTRS